MNKDGYIYLHAVLYLIRTHLEEEYDIPPKTFAEYDELSIEAPHIYKEKEKHKEAIKILSSELADVAKSKKLEEPISSP